MTPATRAILVTAAIVAAAALAVIAAVVVVPVIVTWSSDDGGPEVCDKAAAWAVSDRMTRRYGEFGDGPDSINGMQDDLDKWQRALDCIDS